MAIFHLHVKNISRGDGRSVVAAAAYRAGETLPNEAEEGLSAFGGRRDVIHTEIRLPAGAPAWMGERALLWNSVEAAEIRKDARLAKELEFSLPRELPPARWQDLAGAMADAYTEQGFIVDMAIHDDGTQHNPHVHLLLTTRVVTTTGFGPKIRSADGVQFVTEARAMWAKVANAALGAAGLEISIDNRSHAARSLDQAPGLHRGPDQAERRAKRARARMERQKMRPDDADRDLPVPDAEGNPIHPRDLAAAEVRMLADLEARAVGEPETLTGDRAAAEREVERVNTRELNDDAAAAYRLTPEDPLDWLGQDDPTQQFVDDALVTRWENHLDWLHSEEPREAPAPSEPVWQEPERGR